MAQPENINPNRTRRVFLLFLSLFLFISLFTYTPTDISFYTSDPNIPPVNRAGRLGAFISGYILFLPFGLGAWLVPLLVFLWALPPGLWNPKIWLKKCGGGLLVLFASAGHFTLSGIDTSQGRFPSGGIAGIRICDTVQPWFGEWGAFIILTGFFLIGVLQAAEDEISYLVKSFMPFFKAAAAGASDLIKNKKARRAEIKNNDREPARAEIRAKKREMPAEAGPVLSRPRPAATGAEPPAPARKISGNFKLPPLSLLSLPPNSRGESGEDVSVKIAALEDALHSYNVDCKVLNVNRGPIISSFEVEPARGVKLSQITSLADDIALVMKSQSVRISPLHGKSVIGVEIPNANPRFVRLREVLESEAFRKQPPPLVLGLGTDILGNPLTANLADMPHLLIAGTTGSGKTICLNTIILSILFNAGPDEVKFMMIDPKRVELTVYEGLPHLIAPVVTNNKRASKSLKWVVDEMEKRYSTLSKAGVRNITSFNKIINSDNEKMYHIVVLIDELHDLMMASQSSVEDIITRIAQLSRAVGIHLVIATQRPSVDVITGVIKANLPCRISFQVSSKTDSRTILDANGAEKLIGKGDMLFLPPGKGGLIRAQCSLVSDEETRKVVDFLKKQQPPEYSVELPEENGADDDFDAQPDQAAADDELYDEAVSIVIRTGKGSTSLLQRKLNIGYGRAARLLDRMEVEGIISASRGTKPRTVLKDRNREEGGA